MNFGSLFDMEAVCSLSILLLLQRVAAFQTALSNEITGNWKEKGYMYESCKDRIVMKFKWSNEKIPKNHYIVNEKTFLKAFVIIQKSESNNESLRETLLS